MPLAYSTASPIPDEVTEAVDLSRIAPTGTPTVQTDFGDVIPATTPAPEPTPSWKELLPKTEATNPRTELKLPTLPYDTYTSRKPAWNADEAVAQVEEAIKQGVHPNGSKPGIFHPMQSLQEVARETLREMTPEDIFRHRVETFLDKRNSESVREKAREKLKADWDTPEYKAVRESIHGSTKIVDEAIKEWQAEYKKREPGWRAQSTENARSATARGNAWTDRNRLMSGFPETAYAGRVIAETGHHYKPQEQSDFDAARYFLDHARYYQNTYSELENAIYAQPSKEMGFMEKAYRYTTLPGLANALFTKDKSGKSRFDQFLHGIAPRNVEDAVSFGWAETVHLSRLNSINAKAARGEELTDGEKAMAGAYLVSLDAQAGLQMFGGATTAEKFGQFIGENVPFLVEMALTGGLGSVAGGAVRGLARKGIVKGIQMAGKSGAKGLAGAALKSGAGRYAAKQGANIAGSLVGGAATAPFSNATWNDFARRDAGQYDIGRGADGEIKVVKSRPESLATRTVKSLATGTTELGSEYWGGFAGTGRIFPRWMQKTKVGEVVNRIKRFGQTPGGRRFDNYVGDVFKWNGLRMEWLEEEFSNALEPILTGETERLKENFSPEAQFDTILGVVAMSAAMGAVRTPIVAFDHAHHARTGAKLRSQISDPTLRESLRQIMASGTRQEQAQKLGQIDWNGASMRDRAAAMDYVAHRVEGRVTQDMQEAMREQAAAAEAQRRFEQHKNRDTGNIETVTDREGNTFYLAGGTLEAGENSTADGTVFVIDPETGETSQRSVEELKRGETTTPEQYETGFRQQLETISQAEAEEADMQEIIEEANAAGEDPTPRMAEYKGIDLNGLAGQTVTLADGSQTYINQVYTNRNGFVEIDAVPVDPSTGQPLTNENGEEAHYLLDVRSIVTPKQQQQAQTQGNAQEATPAVPEQSPVQETLAEEQPVEATAETILQEENPIQGSDQTISQPDPYADIQPVGKGLFGNIYLQFRGKAQEAIDFLLHRKEGEAVGALHHPQVGDIDLVWGKEGTAHSDGYGLSKIAKYHPEVLTNLQEIISGMDITKASGNRLQLESRSHTASIRLDWNGEKKTWLLTAFEKETPTPLDRTTDVGENLRDLQNDTAPLQSDGVSKRSISLQEETSQDKTTISGPNVQETEQEIPRKKDGTKNNTTTQSQNRTGSANLEPEIDENGLPFVTASNGSIDFGQITEETGLTPAPIRLSTGENRVGPDGKNHGYGLAHIEAGHGDQIRNAGYNSVEQFVELVGKQYTDIREGAKIGENQTYLLELPDNHNNTLFVQLSKDGAYWNVNSAGIFKKRYSRRKPEVYSVPAVGESIDTDASEVNSGHSTGATAPAGNSPKTSLFKDTTFGPNVQETEQNIPRKKDGTPDYGRIDDPTAVVSALQEEFGEEAAEVARESLDEAHEALEQAGNIRKAIDRRRAQIKAQNEVAKWEAVCDALAPTRETETTEQTAETQAEASPDPVREAATPTEKLRAVGDIVNELNRTSGAAAYVFNDVAELPEGLRSQLEEGFERDGITWRRESYICVPQMQDAEQARRTYIHEVAGHQNVEHAIATAAEKGALWETIVDDIGLDGLRAWGISELNDEIANYEAGEMAKWQLGREALAYATELNADLPYFTREKPLSLTVDLNQRITPETLRAILETANRYDDQRPRITITGNRKAQGGGSLRSARVAERRSDVGDIYNRRHTDLSREDEIPASGTVDHVSAGSEIGQAAAGGDEIGTGTDSDPVPGQDNAGADRAEPGALPARKTVDPVREAATPTKKLRAVGDIVNEMNRASGASAYVFTDVSELPEDLPIKPGDEIDGVTWKGESYICAPQMQDVEQTRRTYIHEVAGHQALGRHLSNREQLALSEAIIEDIGLEHMRSVGIEELNEEIDRYESADRTDARESAIATLVLGREYIAYSTERFFSLEMFGSITEPAFSVDLSQPITDETIAQIIRAANTPYNGRPNITITGNRKARTGSSVRSAQVAERGDVAGGVRQRGHTDLSRQNETGMEVSGTTDYVQTGTEIGQAVAGSNEIGTGTDSDPVPGQDNAGADRAEQGALPAGETVADDIRYRRGGKTDTASNRTLVGVHNISGENLLKAIRLGGMANPSVAVIDIDRQAYNDFGEISLVMPASLIDKRTGRNAGTWPTDAWTPVFPGVERRFGKEGEARVQKDIRSVPRQMQETTRSGIEARMEGRPENYRLAYLFLHERGEAPELVYFAGRYPREVRETVEKAMGDYSRFDRLTETQQKQIADIYIQTLYAGDRNAYQAEIRKKAEKLQQKFREQPNPRSLVARRAQGKANQLTALGYDYQQVNDWANDVAKDIMHEGAFDETETVRRAKEYIEQNGMQEDFDRWRDGLDERYQFREVVFDGFTPTGNRRYVPNTLKNVSRIMRKEGRNGAAGFGISFQNFAAGLLGTQDRLEQIRNQKGKLTPNEAEVDAFHDRWEEVFFELGEKLQPGANRFEDYGLHRLAEAARESDPKTFIKREYGIDFPDEDVRRLKEMVDAIRNDYPATYFETKFERPVTLEEVAAAVVPDNADPKIRRALQEAGVAVTTYRAQDKADRKRALDEATAAEEIRFRNREAEIVDRLSPEQINERFNAELQQQIDGTLPAGHVYRLGRPGNALLSAGIPDLPIELSAERLAAKADGNYTSNHPFTLEEVADLPRALAEPIAVFDSKTQPGSRVILTELQHDGANFVAALKTVNKQVAGRKFLEINSIRSVYPKDYAQDIVNWINRGDLLRWVDKEKAFDWLGKQQSNSADVAIPIKGTDVSANIIKNFANPTLREGEKASAAQTLADELGVPVRVVRSADEISGEESRFREKRGATGWHDRSTGEIAVVLPNCADAAEVQRTILHEAVGHYGLPQLLGRERADELYRRVFDAVRDTRRGRELLDEHGSETVAGDEYLAEMAEGNVSPGVFRRMMAAIRNFFREVLGVDLKLTDADLRYLLWRSRHNLERARTVGEAMEVIEQDIRLRAQTAHESARERKAERLDKLRRSEPLVFSGDEYKGKYELTPQSATRYMLNNIRGEYVNVDTGEKIQVSRRGTEKTTGHDLDRNIHLRSVTYIPQMLENAILIDEMPNTKSSTGFDSYQYYVCGLKIGNTDYTAKIVVGVSDRTLFYDHALTEIEKGKLLESIGSLRSERTNEKSPKFSEVKDKRLISVLQAEPLAYQQETAKNEPKTVMEHLDRLADETTETTEADETRFRKKREPGPDDPIRTTKENLATRMGRKLQDAHIPVRQLQDYVREHGGTTGIDTDVYSALNRAFGRQTERMRRTDEKFRRIEKRMNEIHRKWGFGYKATEEYLAAKSSQERHAAGIAAYAETTDAPWNRLHVEETIARFESVVPKEKIEALWRDIREMTQYQLDVMKNCDLITVQTYRDIQARGWQYYLPLQRLDFEFEDMADPHKLFDDALTTGRGTGAGALLRKARGRTTKPGDVLATLQRNVHLTIMAGEQNLAKQFLLRLAEQNPQMQGDTRTGKGIFEIEEQWFVRRDDSRITEAERERGEIYEKTLRRPPQEEVERSEAARREMKQAEQELRAVEKELRAIDPLDGDNDRLAELQDRRIELERRMDEAFGRITVLRTPPPKHAYTGLSKSEEARFEVPVYRHGVRTVVRLSDANAARAINGDFENLFGGAAEEIVRRIGSATRTMAGLNTSWSPEFMLKNKVRDSVWALFYNWLDKEGSARGYLRNQGAAHAAIYRYHTNGARPLTMNERAGYDLYSTEGRQQAVERYGAARVRDSLYDDFLMEGGLTGYAYMQDLDHYSQKLKKRARRAGNSVLQAFNAAATGFDLLNDLSEVSTRFATFLAQVERGSDVRSAVNYARDVTINFNRRGEWGRDLNALYMFYNASLQGVANLYQLGRRNKTRMGFAMAAVAGLGYGLSFLLNLWLAAMADEAGDDEEWRVSDYRRFTNICLPGWLVGSTERVVTIPLPQELRPAWVLGTVLADVTQGRLRADEGWGTAAAIFNSVADAAGESFLPVEVDSNHPTKTFVPSVFKPLYEIGVNANFMGRKIYREAYPGQTIPESQLGMRNTFIAYKTVCEWLNEQGGGSTTVPAGMNEKGEINRWLNLLDVNPSKAEHLLSSYAGGAGRLIVRTWRCIAEPEDERRASDIPFINAFMADVEQEENPNTRYYDTKEKLEMLNEVYRRSEREGGFPAYYGSAEEAQRARARDKRWLLELRKTDGQIKKLTRERNETEQGSPEYKDKTREMNNLRKDFLTRYDHGAPESPAPEAGTTNN
ncbi:LPD38 domain-containing protein [uncultured Rikenella sp.]|uniref:LPD38 domain-containing protein n=1 Tax=uncultured Rikenella sp. TaxID=368003 RepID=UPI002621F9B1|nr:LPD38 domain-containing protein [uncultured Rikenella sp.]